MGVTLQSAWAPENDPLGSLLPLPAAWRCDLSDDSLRWAPGVFEIFGIDRGAAVERPDIVELYSEESRAELEMLRSDAIAHCRSFLFEARIRRVDGVWRWMRVTADVEIRGGRATHLYGTKQDITLEKAGLV